MNNINNNTGNDNDDSTCHFIMQPNNTKSKKAIN